MNSNNHNEKDINNNNKIDEKFLCKICFIIMTDPIKLKECKHIFCSTCLDNIFNSYKDNM
jgi:hypothetical protein